MHTTRTLALAGLILTGLMVVFIVFGVRTWVRQTSVYEVGEAAIARNGWSILGAGRVSLAWRDVERVKLAFYSTRRDRSKGWMHLKISGGSHRLGIDSIIEGFDDIAARSANAAASNGLHLSESTLRNFAALGLIIMMVGAVDYHRRAGDGPKHWTPAIVMAVLAVLYLVAISQRS